VSKTFKKLSKKEIQEDKLVTTYFKTVGYLNDNKKVLGIIGGVIVVAALIVYFLINKFQNDNLAATASFAKVMEYYDTGSYSIAIDGKSDENIKGLKAIVEEYGSSEQGEIAKIYLANAYFYTNKIEEALKYYSDFGGSDPNFKAAAKAGIAACYEAKNEFEKAADYFYDAANVSKLNVSNATYLLEAGRTYFKLGKSEKAKEILDKLKKEYPNTSEFRTADRYLNQL